MGKKRGGKRRSKSQRTGERGEALFQFWAEKQDLIPNKLPQDYGIDFMCWQSLDVGLRHDVQMVGSAQLAVQVKTTKGKNRKRIKLSKDDAWVILDCQSPFCLVAVDLQLEQVHFRFRDRAFVDELVDFVASADSTRTWKVSDMDNSPERFQATLRVATRTGTQRSVQLYITERTIGLDLPGARLRVEQTSRGGMAMCELPWYGSAFKVEESAWETVRERVFDRGEPPHLGMRGLQLHPSLHPAMEMADTYFAIGGGAGGDVTVPIHGEEEWSLAFELRRVDDERAYVHEVGIGLVVSDRRQRDGVFVPELGREVDGVYVHEFDLRLHRQPGHSLGADPEAMRFLKLMSPGSTLFGKGAKGVPVERFLGPNDLGRALKAVEAVAQELGSDLHDVYLQDLEDDGFIVALGFLEAMLVDRVEPHRLLRGVVFSDAVDGDDWPPTRQAQIRLPIVGNFGARGFVIWLEGTVELFLHAGKTICGYRPVTLELGDFELRPERIPEVVAAPEVWFSECWPGLPIGAVETDTMAVQKKGDLPFGADFIEDVDDDDWPA